MRALRLLPVVLLAALAALPLADARANGPDHSVESFDGQLVSDACGFLVVVHIEGTTHVLAFEANGAGTTRLFFGGPAKLTMTNVATGETLFVNSSGPDALATSPDGSVRINFGPTLAEPVHPVTGEPGLWVLHGRLVAAFDAEDNLIAHTFVGRSTNVCIELAA